MSKSVKKNYVFNVSYQLLTILAPLITTPYISRTVGAKGLGAISFTNSIVSYLIIVATIGMGVYSSRQIAYYQKSREKQTQLFSELLSIKIILLIPALILLMAIIIFAKQYRLLFVIQAGYLLANTFTIDWLYAGNEDFVVTVTRNFVVKIISIVLIFAFVKKTSDLYLYAIILVGSNFLGTISLWIDLKKHVDCFKFSLNNMSYHLKGALSLFSVQIAGSVYLYLDKTMIGMLSSDISENGYYEQAQKIVRLSITLITSLSTVMLPRIANAYKENNNKAIEKDMQNSLKYVFFIGLPMTLGLIACADNIVPWFLGDEFLKCRELLKVFAPVILFNSIYNILGYQYLLAIKKERLVTYIVGLGAILNVIMNILLIPQYGSLGASWASLMAELLVASIMFIIIQKKISFPQIKRYAIKCFIGSLIMFMIVYGFSHMVSAGILQTILLILIGIVTYVLMMYLLKEDYILTNFKRIITKIFNRKSNRNTN